MEIKSIRTFGMGKGEFSELAELERFFKTCLPKKKGIFEYQKHGLRNPKNALVLFQYENNIQAYAVLKDIEKYPITVYENGFEYHGRMHFEVDTINWLDSPIKFLKFKELFSKYKIYKKVVKQFPQGPLNIPLHLKDEILKLIGVSV